ncbi:MAG: ABC transporter substrate-binding protein, partial [Vulcanimicrobiaceae bacterium]
PNVVAAPAGESLVSLFASGGIDAAFAGRAGLGRSGPPSENWESAAAAPVPQAPTPLFADADRLDREWFERSGIYPIHGVVVVKDAVLRSDPAIAGELVRVFTAAKECYLGELDARGAQTEDDRKWAALRTVIGGDPLPYGITENRATLDAIVDYAVDQQILSAPLASADLFART